MGTIYKKDRKCCATCAYFDVPATVKQNEIEIHQLKGKCIKSTNFFPGTGSSCSKWTLREK